MVHESWSSDMKKRAHSGRKEWEVPFEKNRNRLPWNASTEKKTYGNRMLIQTFFSMVFLLLTYFAFHSNSPVAKPIEGFVYEVMTREFNFSGCRDLYNTYVGNMPSVLPTFSNKSVTPNTSWEVPVHGKVVLPYDNKRKGVVVRTKAQSVVFPATEGWVTFSGSKSGFGNMVIIRHADNTETRYGWLQDIQVKEKDWVKRGHHLGSVALTKGQPLLYFAMKKGKTYLDPTGVISFE